MDRWRSRELSRAREQLAKAIDDDLDAQRDKIHVSSLSMERKGSGSVAHLLLDERDMPTTDLAGCRLELELDAEQENLKRVQAAYEERKAVAEQLESEFAAKRDAYASDLASIRQSERSLDDEIRDERIKFTAKYLADTKKQEKEDRRYHCQHASPWHNVVGARPRNIPSDAAGRPGGDGYQAEVLRMRALALRNCEADEAKSREQHASHMATLFAVSKRSLAALLECTAATNRIVTEWERTWWSMFDDHEGKRDAIRYRDWQADVRRDMDHFRRVERERAEALRRDVPDPQELLREQSRKLDAQRQARDRATWKAHHEARERLFTLQQRKRKLHADLAAAEAAVREADAVLDRGEVIRHTQRKEYAQWALDDIAEEEGRLRASIGAAEEPDPDA